LSLTFGISTDLDSFLNFNYFFLFFFVEEVKLVHLNWHRRDLSLRPRGEVHSQVPSQYHQVNPSEFYFILFYFLFILLNLILVNYKLLEIWKIYSVFVLFKCLKF